MLQCKLRMVIVVDHFICIWIYGNPLIPTDNSIPMSCNVYRSLPHGFFALSANVSAHFQSAWCRSKIFESPKRAATKLIKGGCSGTFERVNCGESARASTSEPGVKPRPEKRRTWGKVYVCVCVSVRVCRWVWGQKGVGTESWYVYIYIYIYKYI